MAKLSNCLTSYSGKIISYDSKLPPHFVEFMVLVIISHMVHNRLTGCWDILYTTTQLWFCHFNHLVHNRLTGFWHTLYTTAWPCWLIISHMVHNRPTRCSPGELCNHYSHMLHNGPTKSCHTLHTSGYLTTWLLTLAKSSVTIWNFGHFLNLWLSYSTALLPTLATSSVTIQNFSQLMANIYHHLTTLHW